MKTIDLNKSIHDLTAEYPELISIMKELGFIEITNPVSLNTVGRLMTIPKGSAMKNIPWVKSGVSCRKMVLA